MWKKKVIVLMALSASLCANEQAEFNDGIKHLRSARQATKNISNKTYQTQVNNCIDTALQILNNTEFDPHAGQLANAVFFDCCNALMTVPDDATMQMLKELDKAETAFRQSLFTRMEQDRRLGK